MSEQNLKAEKIHIRDFRITKATIDSPIDYALHSKVSYRSDVNYELGFNREQRLARANFMVTVHTDDKDANTSEASTSFEFVFLYEIENLEELIEENVNNQNIIIDFGLSNALASITYSTARGILMSRLQGTVFSNFILPVISPNSLFKN
jgi:hypothetical protein